MKGLVEALVLLTTIGVIKLLCSKGTMEALYASLVTHSLWLFSLETIERTYNKEIEKAQTTFDESCKLVERLENKLEISKVDLQNFVKKLSVIEANLHCLAESQNNEHSITVDNLKMRYDDAMLGIQKLKELIGVLEESVNISTNTSNICERQLNDIKQKAREVNERAKLNRHANVVYDNLVKLRFICKMKDKQ